MRADDYDALEQDFILFKELYHREQQSKLAAQDALQDSHTELTETKGLLETMERHAADMQKRLAPLDGLPSYAQIYDATINGRLFDCLHDGVWGLCDKATCHREQQCSRRTTGPLPSVPPGMEFPER